MAHGGAHHAALVESELKPQVASWAPASTNSVGRARCVPGDELRIESGVIEMRRFNSRPEQGLIKVRTTTFHQNGKVVKVLVSNLVVPRRGPGGNKRPLQ